VFSFFFCLYHLLSLPADIAPFKGVPEFVCSRVRVKVRVRVRVNVRIRTRVRARARVRVSGLVLSGLG
jgi:hypothetical protein